MRIRRRNADFFDHNRLDGLVLVVEGASMSCHGFAVGLRTPLLATIARRRDSSNDTAYDDRDN